MNQTNKSNPKENVTSLRMYEAKESFSLMALGIVTGLASGLAAVLLNWTVKQIELWREAYSGSPSIILFPAIGAGLGIFIQRNMLSDQAGHGVPDVIRSVTVNKGILKRRMLFSRLISSCLTIGMGGAAGLEGPIVVSGGAAGSTVGSFFNLSERRRILLIACGTSGAIGAIFNAPLTGLVFSLEVILGEWKSRNLIPTVTSAAVATQVSRHLMGYKIPFPHGQIYTTFLDLPTSIMLGVLCAYMGWAFVKSLSLFGSYFQKLAWPIFLKAGLGGLAVGCIGYLQFDAMGEGYHLVDMFINNEFKAGLWMLLIILFLRLVTSSLTLSSGGSGGVFAPALFFGSALGFLFGSTVEGVGHLFGDVNLFASPGAYALIGMAGLVAGLMSAPLTGMFLIFEISDSYSLILPLMVCALTSMLVYRYLERGSIYTHDLLEDGDVRFRGSALHILTEIESEEIVSPCPTVEPGCSLQEFVQTFGDTLPSYIAIVGHDGKFQNMVFLTDIKPVLLDPALHSIVFLDTLADRSLPKLKLGFRPDEALLQFGSTRRNALPVINAEGALEGIVTKGELLDSIRREILVQE